MSAVRLEKRNDVGVIVIDDPPVNALGRSVRRGIVDCLDKAEGDGGLRAIVLTGNDRLFSAGADIREFGEAPAAPLLPDVVHRLESSAKPVVAAIRGPALGGGLEIALGCHYRLAAEGAALGFPEVALGLLPGATGTQRLPRLVGVEAALDMMLDGKPVDAATAARLGLVDDVAADEGLEDAALRFARERMGEPPRRLRESPVPAADPGLLDSVRKAIAAKTRGLLSPEKIVQCVEAAVRLEYEAGCAFERDAFLECRSSPQSDGLRHAFFAERQAAKLPQLAGAEARDVERIAVLGAGTMGAGIAYAALCAGHPVTLIDNDDAGLDRGLRTIDGYFEYALDKGKLDTAGARSLRERLTTDRDIGAAADADLVIEAVFESMAVKQEVFRALDAHCKPGAVLATNTSTLDVDAIAAATRRPEDVVGLHFFSPAHVMRLLEIVRGRHSSPEVLATALAVAKRLGKIGVVVGNCFGFVGNRMLYGYGRENQLMLLEGAAPEDIDRALCDWGMAMGPNAVGDLAGLDVGYRVRSERDDLPDDPRFYRVADLLAEQGRYGRKTGRGMFRYEKGSKRPLPDPEVRAMIRAEARRLGIEQRDIAPAEIVERCILGLVTEGARILEEGIARRASDIDVIWINGYGFPRHRGGPMHYADRLGPERVCARLRGLANRCGPEYWQVPELLTELAETGGSFGAWRHPDHD